MPQMGVSVAEGTIVAWPVSVGEPIAADAAVCEISTDKIDVEVPSPVTGVVAEILVDVGETVDVGTVLARIATGDAAVCGVPASAERRLRNPSRSRHRRAPPAAAPRSQNGRRPALLLARRPADRRRARRRPRAGRRDRARRSRAQARRARAASRAIRRRRGGAAPHREPLPARPAGPGHRRGRRTAAAVSPGGLSRMRRQIGAHMKRSLDTAATCTTWIEVDMSRIEAARARSASRRSHSSPARRSPPCASTRR